MLNKKLMILTIILVSVLAVSAVSAADNATSDVVSLEETTDEVVSADENQVILSENNDVGGFDDLQTEINNATEGSVLNLTRDYNGAYGSKILLDKELTIDGQGHTLDCLGEGECIAFYSTSGTITLKNLKIINGHNDFNNKGGAIHIEGSAQYTIINCTFEKNWAEDYGGAIYSSGDLDIINCTFKSNSVEDDNGGAIYCEKSVYLENCLFEKNHANVDGGAIYSKNNVNVTKNTRFIENEATGASSQCYGGAIRSEGNVEVDHATFTSNNAYDYGGAIYANTASIYSSNFEKNRVEDNDGGAVYVESSIDVRDSKFYKNVGCVDGGAIYSRNSVNVKNSNFSYNNVESHKVAVEDYGGAIRAEGDVTVDGSRFNDNWARFRGGAIECDGDLHINNTKFKSNKAYTDGGAIYCKKSVFIENGVFEDNHADVDGGAIYSKNNVNVKNTRFSNNVADDGSDDGQSESGGAILSKGDVKIDNCTFNGNHARDYGGAIYADTITWVDSPSYFKGNYVDVHDGGAIYANKFTTDVKYGVFINNEVKSEKDGGAIYINKENHILFSQCYFENNKCGDEGGAIYLDSTSSKLYLEYNIFVGNNAENKGNIVYNKGKYNKIHNNWYATNAFDFSNELVEYNFWGSDKSHQDDNPVTVELSLNETSHTVIVRFISYGELFNYDAKFSADNGANFTNHKTANNMVTSDIELKESITTVIATVNKQVLTLSYSFTKENVTMVINPVEISFGDNATVNIIFTPDNATGTVSVGNISADIVNGEATVIIPDLSVGTHTLQVNYSGDGLYNPAQGNVTVTVNRKNLNIDASAKPIHKGENATVIVTGLERATGNVNVTINNNNWTGEIINGAATINITGLNENTTANVTYIGDANYTDASTTVNIIVNPEPKLNLTISASADPIMVGDDAAVIVNGLENATGNVTVTINNNNWTGEIIKGTATIIVTGLNGNATANVSYAGDYRYNNATTTVNITVNPASTVWYVNGSKESSGNGTTPDTAFKTLKEALRKAPENSTIYIAPGTYTGENNINLTINKNNLSLVNYGAGEVIFDAQSSSRILTVNAGRINITGLTFKNGKEEYVCGAVFFSQTLNNSYINATFIDNNVVDGHAGAIGFYADVINTDIDSIFINNSVDKGYGGAIFFNGNLNNVNISGNYTANTAGDYGGAILFYGDLNNVSITGNYTANTADDGGAILFYGKLTDVNITGYYNNNQANDTAGVFLFNNNLTNVIISGDYINNVAHYCAVYYMGEFATVNDTSISGDYYNNSANYCVVLLIEGTISDSNISGNYTNNHAKKGIYIIGEAYNVNMSGNYVNNDVSNGSAIYIGYCDGNSVIHDSIFINNTMDDELIIDVESGSVSSVNNWFGNNATYYNIKPKVSENVAMANWLFLNATTNIAGEIAVNQTAEVTFKLYAYNSVSEEINEYDASKMNAQLDLSEMSGTLNQTDAFIDETVLYERGEEGIATVTGKFKTTSYTIRLARPSTKIIINKTEMTLKVNESVLAGATLNPPEAGNLTYASSNDTVAVVENGIIKGLKEGTAIITVSFEGNDEYAPAVSKTITVHVEKRIPVINASANVTDNRVTIHVDIDGYDGWISMNISDSLIYFSINSSLSFVQILDYGIYNVNITALGNYMFYPGSEILTFTVLEPEKLNTSIAAQPSVNVTTVTITVDVDSNASGFVEISIEGKEYYVPVVNGTAVFINDYSNGSYVANVTYLGDENYNTNSTQTAFTVTEPAKQNTTVGLVITVDENWALFNASVNKSASGLVKFQVFNKGSGENKTFYMDVENGEAFSSMFFEKGNYTITVTYLGDDVFNNNSTSKDFDIVGHVMKDTPITAEPDVNGYKVTISVSVDSNATGFVEVKYDDTVINIALTNGNGTYTTTLPAGSYNVNLTYLGDENYNKNSTKVSFTVDDPVKENTTIGLEIVIDENWALFNASVNKSASGLVKFQVFNKGSGENKTFYMDVENGEAFSSMFFEKGNYTITVTYLGDDVFNNNSTSKDFDIVGHVMKDTPITAQKDVNGYKVTISVSVDSNATGFVEVKYDDTVINIALTNGNGTYTTTLPAGSYNVNLTYLGDENYNKNSTKVSFTVDDPVKENTTIGLEIVIDENWALFNASVNKSASGLVKFQVFNKGSGENKTFYMDVENGEAIYSMFFEKGNYTVTATYLGDDVFDTNATSKDFDIVGHVMKDTPITAQKDVNGYKVTISVSVDSNATGFVEVKYDDTIVNIALTNGNGTYTTTLPAGSYNVNLTYLGDENYNKNSTILSFSVDDPVKENTTVGLVITVDENWALFNASVNKSASGLVKFQVFNKGSGENKTFYMDVENGEAIYSMFFEKGNYTVTATYLGDDVFDTNATSKDFDIVGHVMKDTPITAQKDVNGYKVTISVSVDFNATGFVEVKYDDTVINIALTNGNGTYTATLPAGSYNVNLTYLGDENYNKNSTKLSFSVDDPVKENTTISLNVSSVENFATFTVNVNPNATGIVKFEITGAEEYTAYMDIKDGKSVLEGFLNAGNYTIVATYLGDDVFNTNDASKDFKITGHVMKDTPITAQKDVNGYKVTITVDVDDDATGFVEVKYGDTIVNIALTNGTGTYTATLPAGSYNVNLTYLGDENYNKNSTKLSFSVDDPVKENTTISLNVSSVENFATFTVNVNPNATGIVKFEITGAEEYTAYMDIKDGKSVLEGFLNAGNYTIVATYLGDDVFNTNDASKEFEITGHVMKDTPITAQKDVNGYKVTITVDVDDDATGFVEVKYGDTIVNIALTNGNGTYTATLPAGSYNVNLTYLGDENYNKNSTKLSFSVDDPVKENTTISLNVSSVENFATFTVNVNPNATGIVKFEITGAEEYTAYMDIKDGKSVLEGFLNAGNYTIVATYLGDDVFNTNDASKEFEITGHVMKDTSITAQKDVNGYKVTISVSVDSNATGFVEVKYDDTIVNIALANGNGTYSATLPAGSYNVNLTYLGDENYNKNSTKLSFSVDDPVKENTTISLDVQTIENNVTFAVNVDKDATGLVKFEVNDTIGTVLYADVNDGQVVLSGLLAAGNYTVVATYMGDDRFNTNITYKNFTVIGHIMKDTSITAEADVKGYKVTISVAVDLDATGFVRLQIGDTIANVELENGTGTYTTTLPAGSYYVKADYLGDENYNTNSTQTAFTITEPAKQNTTIGLDIAIVENGAMFNASVDKLAGGLVKFQVFNKGSGENKTFYVDVENGAAIVSMFFEKGNYTIIATYLGDDVFNTNHTSKDFKIIGHVMKDTPITAEAAVNGYKVTITVDVDDDATGFVEVKYDDTIINIALTNGTGTYTATLPAGSYNVNLTYLGDENYNKNSTKASFSVDDPVKENTPISLDVETVENTAIFTVNVDKDATGLVKFEVNDEIGTVFYADVKDGQVVLSGLLAAGNYTVVATYMGDSRFNTNSTYKNFTVIGHLMKDTPITAEADVNGYKVTINVNVDSGATGFVRLQFGDTIANVELENGNGTYTTALPAGSYNVNLTYLGDENYNKNSTKLSFNVADPVKENTPISLDVETVENNVILTVNVDKDATGLVKFEVNDEIGTVLYADVKDGQAMLSGLLAAGNYTVVATYMGDARFNTNITYKDFAVIGHLMKDTLITAQADVSGYKVTVTVAVDSDATGFVKLQIGDAIVNVELENGIGTYTTTLPAGSYYVQATYLGDENYNTNSTQIAFTVTDPVKENTTIDLNVLINENEVIFNTTVNELATGLVKLQIFNKESGKNETVYMDVNNGVAESDYVIDNGNYTIIATYLGDAVFNSNTTSKDFEVIGHVMKDTPITAQADVNGYKVTITADVDSNATGFVEIKYADTQVYIALENGTGTYVTTLPAGSYNVEVTYAGDDNFNENSTKLSFTVEGPVKENTPISIDVSSVENNVTFTVNVNPNASGIVRFDVSGAEEYVVYADVINGVAVMGGVLEAGDYTVVATYMGDDRFNSNVTSESVTVKGHIKKDTPIIADAKVNGNKVTITVNVDENATGFVGLKQSGSTIYVALENGVATYTDVLPAGSYNVEVTYAGDDNFNENSTKVLFTVIEAAKENTTIAANVSVVDGNVTFIVFVNENATGIVKFDVTGTEESILYVDVVGGKAVLEGVSKSGNYTLVATYMGDERFNSNVTSVDFTVSVPEKQDTNVSICIPSDIKPGDNATVEVSIPNATGNVSVIVDGKETVVPLVNGSASVPLEDLTSGNHSVVVIYPGDETHASAHSASAFNVPVAPVVVKDATEFAEIVVSADKITAVLKDSQGKTVSGAVISYAIGDVSNTTTTDENGTFSIGIVSKSVVAISYAGNDSLLGTNTSIVVDSVVETKLASQFNVTEGISIKTYAVDLKAGEIGCVEYFKLTDSNGNPIANATIKFAYKSVILNRTTDENGIVYLGINTYVAQTAICAMSYLGNEKYNATFVAFSFDIQLKPISITAKAKTFKKSTKTKKYTVTLKTKKCNSRDGKVYLSSGKKVTLKVNGKTYTAKTNSKGQATFKITKLTKKGKYTAVIKFAGDKTYESASKNVKITVK